MRLIILTHGRKELTLSMVALVESTGKFKDPNPEFGHHAQGIHIKKGRREIHSYEGRAFSQETKIVDAAKDHIDVIWNAVNALIERDPIIMDFTIDDNGHSRKVLVYPGNEVVVGCVTVSKEQMEEIIKAWNKQ